ncbi:MAG TPA: tetratricopeptide repeat protein, partial [Bacteroidia bacterium]|nr:tetratricopeptide repeat protein [Bacteroidia bacterium]
MTLRRWFVLAFLLILQPAIAQKTAIFLDPDRNYREGLDLFGKQKYGAAREYFEAVLKNPKGSQESRMGSAYYIGACAAELFHKDAEARLEQFLTEYPESPYYQEALYVTGNYRFRQKKYKKSADWFGRIDMARANQDRKDEVNFKTGYG